MKHATPRNPSQDNGDFGRCAYSNASKVLPPELLQRVRKFATGLLWVPASSRRLDKTRGLQRRDAEIRRARREGSALRDLSLRFHRSVTRIREICRGTPRLRRSALSRARRTS